MQCRDIRELFDSFLSDELLTETNHEILRHLETCPGCRMELAGRRALRAALQAAFERAPDLQADPNFVNRLGTTLDRARHDVPARRRWSVGGWWAVAATVLLGVALAGGIWSRGWITTALLARAAVGDHRNCALQFRLAEKPISLEEAAQRYGAVYRVLEDLPPVEVSTSLGVALVIERHSCVYEGRRFAHVVLRYRDTPVSLLVTSLDGSPWTTMPQGALPHLTGIDRVDDMAVISFRTARHVVFLTGDVDRADLAKLADAVAPALYERLG